MVLMLGNSPKAAASVRLVNIVHAALELWLASVIQKAQNLTNLHGVQQEGLASPTRRQSEYPITRLRGAPNTRLAAGQCAGIFIEAGSKSSVMGHDISIDASARWLRDPRPPQGLNLGTRRTRHASPDHSTLTPA